MQGLLGLSRAIDAMTTMIGRWMSWLILVAVLVSATNATVRYLVSSSSNAWLELQWYLFAAVFLLVSPWTLLQQEHIRIDIVNSRFSKRVRDWIELLGHLFFLLPVCLVMLRYSIPFAQLSLTSGEISQNAGGLIVWPAKILIPIGFALLFVQGVSETIKRIAIMQGLIEDHHGGGHHAAAEAEAQRLIEAAQGKGAVETPATPVSH